MDEKIRLLQWTTMNCNLKLWMSLIDFNALITHLFEIIIFFKINPLNPMPTELLILPQFLREKSIGDLLVV